LDREPNQSDRGVVVGEVASRVDHLADLHVQALDGVRRVDDAADLLGEGEERDHRFPGVPDPERRGAGLAVGPRCVGSSSIAFALSASAAV